jgi:hypothetical protein
MDIEIVLAICIVSFIIIVVAVKCDLVPLDIINK